MSLLPKGRSDVVSAAGIIRGVTRQPSRRFPQDNNLQLGATNQHLTDGRPTDLECLGDVDRPHALRLQFAHP
jgi:hypothetical protein